MNKIYYVCLISDSTGETLDRIFLAIKAQFSNFDCKAIHYSFTRTQNQIEKILSKLNFIFVRNFILKNFKKCVNFLSVCTASFWFFQLSIHFKKQFQNKIWFWKNIKHIYTDGLPVNNAEAASNEVLPCRFFQFFLYKKKIKKNGFEKNIKHIYIDGLPVNNAFADRWIVSK